jgi:2,5-diketo-D-gluconate reductase A
MPMLGLGTWKLTNDTAEVVEGALEAGYRLIDTSSDYGSQAGIGEALRRTSVPREEIFVTAKIEETDEPVEGVLRDLSEMGLGYADLVLIHRPPEDGAGEFLWEGLMRARDEGSSGTSACRTIPRAGRPAGRDHGRGARGQPGGMDALRA